MKNIHLLPTENSSRLSYNENGVLKLNRLQWRKGTQNIYITSDEEIKEGDWVYSVWDKEIKKASKNIKDALFLKKIILTTDQDLIKDGVQAIDDEFLEWFVKNPSCEEVKIVNNWDYNNKGFVDHSGYKIIIPKEESFIEYTNTNDCTSMIYNSKEEPKQETLEEFANKAYPFYGDVELREAIELGAKWQQERSYSEEEVYDIVQKAIEENSSKQLHFFDGGYSNPVYSNLKKWFEQFKKK